MVRLEGQHVSQHAALHAFELLLEADVRAEGQEDDELLFGLDLEDVGVGLEDERTVGVGDGVIEQQCGLYLERVIFLVGQHDPSLIGHSLIDNDADHPLLAFYAFQHLLAQYPRQLDLVNQTDGVGVALFTDVQFAMVGRAFADLLRVRCNDDVGGCAGLDHQAELVLAVVGALTEQEISHLDGAFGEFQVEEGNSRALEWQHNFPILPGQYSPQIQLTRQFQEKLALHSPIISQFKSYLAMSLTNLALRAAGAKVIAHSSYNNEGMHHPSHVLEDKEEKIWNSGSGLPQFITISLEEVELSYTQIARIGFHCWHDYTTNPKTIEVEVAPTAGDKMVLWCRLTLKQKSGKQVFDITPLPASYRIIKVAIVETFGEYETYLNQIYLFAQVAEATHSELAVNDLQSPGNSYSKYEKEQSSEEEQEFQENTFHNKQTYAGPQRVQSPSSKYSEQQELDHSLQNDVALLTLSKNVMEMEENIEDIKRALEVLTVRVDMTYDKLEKKIMEKVEGLLDSKLQRVKQQIKNQLKRSSQLRDSKSQQQIDFLRSVDYEQQPRPVRESKQSLHIHNLKSNRVQPKQASSKNPVVSELMIKLAKKLQQRQLKVKKIESKRADRPSK